MTSTGGLLRRVSFRGVLSVFSVALCALLSLFLSLYLSLFLFLPLSLSPFFVPPPSSEKREDDRMTVTSILSCFNYILDPFQAHSQILHFTFSLLLSHQQHILHPFPLYPFSSCLVQLAQDRTNPRQLTSTLASSRFQSRHLPLPLPLSTFNPGKKKSASCVSRFASIASLFQGV